MEGGINRIVIPGVPVSNPYGVSPLEAPEPVTPSIIRVVRVSDYANFAKVGEPIVIQGMHLSCLLILEDTETPGNTFEDTETPGNILINS